MSKPPKMKWNPKSMPRWEGTVKQKISKEKRHEETSVFDYPYMQMLDLCPSKRIYIDLFKNQMFQ